MPTLIAIFRGLGFLVLTLPLMPLQQIFLWISPTAARHLPHYYHHLLCIILGIKITVEGAPPSAPAMIIANHVSWADIPVLSGVLPVSFVAKSEVAGWPLFGTLARLQRTVFIDRKRRHSTGQSKNLLAERLLGSDVLVLFPEGTSHNGKTILPFKSSYLGAVENSSINVVPLALAYRRRQGLPLTHRQCPEVAWYGDMDLLPHLWNFLKQGPVEVTVRFLAPLHKADRKTLAHEAEGAIRLALVEMLHRSP